MSLVVPTGLRAVTLGDDRRGQGWVRTEECERQGLRWWGDPALASDSEGAARVALRPWDVQEQGLVAQGVRADRVPSAPHVSHWGRRVWSRLRTG